jgi:hypothetical protein
MLSSKAVWTLSKMHAIIRKRISKADRELVLLCLENNDLQEAIRVFVRCKSI